MRHSALNRALGLGSIIISLGLLRSEMALAAAIPPALQDLQPRLAAIVKRSQPNATLKWDEEEEELVGQYQTQPFQVHRTAKSGQISTHAYTEWGPNYQGFLMRLRVDKTPYAGQSADPFGVRHRTYWDEYINEYPLRAGGGSVLRLELTYGSRVDSKLVEQIKDTIAHYVATVARVAAIEHIVEVKNGASDYHAATPGATLTVGDFVRTGRRSKADIKFADGSLLRLGQLAEAKVSAFDKIQILSGQALFLTLHPGMTIITKDGVAAVKG